MFSFKIVKTFMEQITPDILIAFSPITNRTEPMKQMKCAQDHIECNLTQPRSFTYVILYW